MIIKSKFGFKGTRTYVHGTDIFNFITSHLEIYTKDNHHDLNKFTLSFIKQTKTNIDFYIGTKEQSQQFGDYANLTFRGNVNLKDSQLHFWGIENNNAVDFRYEYDEKTIEDKCIYHDKKISFDSTLSKLTFIENLIPMYKKLLALNCPQYDGKWMFAKLDLNKIPEPINNAQLTLEMHNDSNPKLVCAHIIYNKDKLGRIFFSLN